MTKYFGLSNLEDGIIIKMVELSLREKRLQVWRVLLVFYYFVVRGSILDVLRCLFYIQLEMSSRVLGIQVWS